MENIDFVVTWVDGNDPEWLCAKEKYTNEMNLSLNSDARYRDWGIFKYWFRAVEKYAPWVNKIYLITEGHIPEWLDTTCEKISIIKHSDYIDSKFLPTFNSNVIELNMYKISNLSENFVYFNDDMFLNNHVFPSDFFNKDGDPKDVGIFSPIIGLKNTISSTLINNIGIINSHFNSRNIIKNNFLKFFNLKYGKHLVKNICLLPWKNIVGFYDEHLPISYKKSFFRKVILDNSDIEKCYSNRFRMNTDFSHWVVRYTMLCLGNFSPRSINFGKMYAIEDDFEILRKNIINSKYKVLCLEDGESVNSFEITKSKIISLFEQKYPNKSSFEK